MQKRIVEIIVGLFMLAGAFGLLVLAFKVSSFNQYEKKDSYNLTADFDNVGGLKVRAPVEISGVKIGQVSNITLDQMTFKAKVTMTIDDKSNDLPVDTSASILTQGLLGSNYISLSPGFSNDSLKPNGVIDTTNSALILENLIGQLMFKLNGSGSSSSSSRAPESSTEQSSTPAPAATSSDVSTTTAVFSTTSTQ